MMTIMDIIIITKYFGICVAIQFSSSIKMKIILIEFLRLKALI